MHNWLDQAIPKLAALRNWSYAASTEVATEPTALSALALLSHAEITSAQAPLGWLVRQQAADGSLGVTAKENTPCWPTSLAALAWCKADQTSEKHRYFDSQRRACEWLLSLSGTTPPRASHVGHDTTIPGWPWVAGTHSWLEPTAFSLLALEACGYMDHARVHAARKLIVDRLLPHGGANYGNTVVLGQDLLPHIQPSGIALCAIPPDTADPRVQRTIDYLLKVLPSCKAPHSLCFGLLGLAAHGVWPKKAESWLARGYAQLIQKGECTYTLALLCVAALGPSHPLQIDSQLAEISPSYESMQV